MAASLLRATTTVGSMTFVSRVLGFLRDIVIARMVGASMGADAFFVAFKVPNFMRRLFAEGAFSQAFVPVVSEYKSQRGQAEVQDLVDHVTGVLGSVLLALVAAGVLAAPVLVMVFAPGFWNDPVKFDLTADMLRITFPYLLVISLVAMAGGILNTYSHFWAPAATPILLNLAIIAAAVGLAPSLNQPALALAWGVLAGGVVQLLFQIPFLRRAAVLPRPRLRRRHAGVGKILRLMGPAVLGSSVAQINLLIDTIIASFLVTGSVSWLYYADRLVEFPLGVFGIALATVILPRLSQRHAEASPEQFARTLDWGLRWVLMIGAPATLGLLLLAAPMLATLFNYGAFGADDVDQSARALMAYAVGLLGFILVKVLATGFYARQDTRTPVRIAVVAMVVNMVLNVVLVFPLAHAGLALATALAALLNAGLLLTTLWRQGVYRPQPGWWLFLARVGAACVALVALLGLGVAETGQWLAWDAWQRAWHLAAWVIAAGGVYFAVLLVGGVRPRDLKGSDL